MRDQEISKQMILDSMTSFEELDYFIRQSAEEQRRILHERRDHAIRWSIYYSNKAREVRS